MLFLYICLKPEVNQCCILKSKLRIRKKTSKYIYIYFIILLLLLFEHSLVINQSSHAVSAVTVEMALIWTAPLGLTWSLTLMPFSATGTFLPLFHPPPALIQKSRAK